MSSMFKSFFGLFGAKPKYPGKYAIVPEGQRGGEAFCLSSELFRELDAIIARSGESVAMEKTGAEGKEFKLASTEQHAAFVADFEQRLEAFIVEKGCTPEEFYKMCEKAQEMGDENIEGFISILLQMLEFQTFSDLCSDPNKRKYLQMILAHYSKALTEDA